MTEELRDRLTTALIEASDRGELGHDGLYPHECLAGVDALLPVVAAYVAAERERVLAPIRALAEELRREAPHQEAWDGDVVLAYRDIADRITQAAAPVASPADQPEGSQ